MLCKALLSTRHIKVIVDSETKFLFPADNSIDDLLTGFMDFIPEQPVNYYRPRNTINGSHREEEKTDILQKRVELIDKVEKIMQQDDLDHIINEHDEKTQELLIWLYATDHDVMGGHLYSFLRDVTRQELAYVRKQIDAPPTSWHGKRSMRERIQANALKQQAETETPAANEPEIIEPNYAELTSIFLAENPEFADMDEFNQADEDILEPEHETPRGELTELELRDAHVRETLRTYMSEIGPLMSQDARWTGANVRQVFRSFANGWQREFFDNAGEKGLINTRPSRKARNSHPRYSRADLLRLRYFADHGENLANSARNRLVSQLKKISREIVREFEEEELQAQLGRN